MSVQRRKVWAYFRCSTDMQERSIPDQRKAMQQVLDEHDLEIVECFEDEGVSGVDPVEKRPGFSDMLARAKMGVHKRQDIALILCYDISRWGRFRDPLDSIAYMQELKRAGLPVYFTDDKYISFAADTRQSANAILTVLGSMEATGYSQERSKLVHRGKKSIASDGYWTGGMAPYGMVRVIVDEKGEPIQVLELGERKVLQSNRVLLAPGPKEQVKAVQMMFDLRADGWGYGSIAKHLNKLGIPAAKNDHWKAPSVYRILKNPVYSGDMVYGRRNVSKFNDMDGKLIWNQEKDWVRVVDAWDAIIDRDTWEKVQKSFGGTSRRFGRSEEYPLSGIMECAQCGWRYYGNTVSQKKKTYYYYVHRNDRASVTAEHVCSAYCLPRDLVENFVIQEAKKALLEQNVEKTVSGYIKRYIEANTGDNTEKLTEIDKELASLEMRENNARNAMEKGVDPAFVMQSIGQISLERESLEEKRADLKNSERVLKLTDDDVANICCAVADYIKDFEASLARTDAESRREMLRCIVDRIIVDRPGNLATVYIRQIPDLSGVENFFLNNLDNENQFVYHYTIS